MSSWRKSGGMGGWNLEPWLTCVCLSLNAPSINTFTLYTHLLLFTFLLDGLLNFSVCSSDAKDYQ